VRKFILSIDQGTTGSTAALVDHHGVWLNAVSVDFAQIFPKPGWVEHDPEDIWSSVKLAVKKLVKKTRVPLSDILSIGITNQRETVVLWDSDTGKPVYNALVWQCRRTTNICEKMKNKGFSKIIKEKTGLVLDPYFSASKVLWILENVPRAKQLLKSGKLRIGTVDSFLLWRLTGGKSHKTEVSNASRTMLMNLNTLDWDPYLLKLFRIPRASLPEIHSSDAMFGKTNGLDFLPDGISIAGILGDQQAALFGQACFKPGAIKCTFGTGSFILMNTGNKILSSNYGMLTTVAWKIGSRVSYAIEGGAFVCGAAVQWLRDGLGIISKSEEVERLAKEVNSSDGVEFVPALTGLGAPYWNAEARGVISGITRGTTRGHIARATLEAMALQNVDLITSMEKDLGRRIKAINVDGGATANNLLMQIQSDYLGKKVIRPRIIETTAYGAALVAGLGIGLWSGPEELVSKWNSDREFSSKISKKEREKRISSWKKAIERTIF
jgi:glycerol kinase